MTKDDKSAHNEAVPQDKKNSWPELTKLLTQEVEAERRRREKLMPEAPREDVVGEYLDEQLSEAHAEGLAYPGQVPEDRLIAYNPGPDHLAMASEKVRQAWLAAHPNLVDQWKSGAVETALQEGGYNPADAPTTTLLWTELVEAARHTVAAETRDDRVFLPKGQLPELGDRIRMTWPSIDGVVSAVDESDNSVLLQGSSVWRDVEAEVTIEVLDRAPDELRIVSGWWEKLQDEPDLHDFETLLAQLGLRGEKA